MSLSFIEFINAYKYEHSYVNQRATSGCWG